MYKKILAAVNEHLNSKVMACYALNLAKELNANSISALLLRNAWPSITVDDISVVDS